MQIGLVLPAPCGDPQGSRPTNPLCITRGQGLQWQVSFVLHNNSQCSEPIMAQTDNGSGPGFGGTGTMLVQVGDSFPQLRAPNHLPSAQHIRDPKSRQDDDT
ncbi:hypothetical protein HZ326_22341 [Fusarium oxysporum f. sp. albedinis]|nr:hypothetical protein HZ326_22341 [Fusarium oxysporum f. sp. albedinis]